MRSLLKPAVILIVLWFFALAAFCQAPHIAYVNPGQYKVGEGIAVLSPSNTGGAVPATVYGTVSTFAGQPGVRGTNDGSLTTVSFNGPWGIEHDASGNFYVVDNQSGIVRKISTSGQVSTFAGSGSWGYGDGQGSAAQFSSPFGIAIDNAGNLYVADDGNEVIRKVTPGGLVSTLAGKTGFPGDADGNGNQAMFYSPLAVAADNGGNVYVADYQNNKIRKITPAGSVTTFAGSGVSGSADGDRLTGSFNLPHGVATDVAGNLFVADFNNYKLRKVGSDGKISTIAGSGNEGFADGTGAGAAFSSFLDLKVDAGGNIYVSDTYNNAIRLVTPSGRVITVAGSGAYGLADGVGKDAKFSTTAGITLYNGAAYIVDVGNYVIRKMITTGYLIDKPLPAGLNFDSTTGKISGTPTAESPATDYTVIAFNQSGSSETTVKIEVVKSNASQPVIVAKPDIKYTTPNVYVRNIGIPPLKPTNTGGAVPATIYGETKVIAGTGQFGGTNGDAATAQFKLPYGISVDPDGNIYIAESGGGVRMISAGGQVSSLGTDALPGPPFNVPKLNNPRGIVKDKAGNLFVANYSNHNILKITPSGTVTVFAGISQAGTADGPGNVANIINPNGIAIDKDDNLYVTDGNNAIRKISPAGYVYTLAGQPAAGTVDGQGRAARFKKPAGIVVDDDGNIYVSDQGGFVIRKITPGGFVTTIAGNGTFSSNDGTGTAAGFQAPIGMTVDKSGNLYITDMGIGTIRRISPDGEVKTIAGGGPNGVNSGVGTDVHFSSPEGLTVGPDGNLYVAEYGGNDIKQVIATGYTIDKVLPTGLTFDPRTGIVTGTPTVLWPLTDYTVTAYNAGGSSKFVLSIEVTDVAVPAIGAGNVSGTATACVGSASANYQQFTVSEINLTADVLVTAPTNFEVSLTPSGGYGNSLIIPLADLQLPPDGDGITVYVRLAASAPVGNPAGDVILKSTGATDVNVPVSGTVKPVVTPAVVVNQDTPPGCPGQAVTFVAVPTNGGVNPTYQWFVNGSVQGTNNDHFTTATISSTDKVTVKLTNNSDCTTTPSVTSAPVSPTYKPLVTPAITITQAGLVCPGQPVTFNASVTNAGVNPVYGWQLNGINQNNNSLTFIAPATITATDKITATLINTSDCTASATGVTSVPLSPVYKPLVTPSITISQAGLVCPGQPVVFNASVTNAGVNPVYSWQINGIDQNNNSLTFISPATITTADKVTATLINTSDCTASATGVTSVPLSPVYKPLVVPSITIAQAGSVCPGQPVIFNASVTNAGVNPVYSWQINGIDQNNNSLTFTSPATITAADKVTATLINTSDCTASANGVTSTSLSPVYKPLITLSVSISQPNLVCPGQTVSFVANTNTGGSNPAYQWFINGVPQSSTGPSFTAPVTITAADKVTVELTNSTDCTAQATVTSAPFSPAYKPVVTPGITVEQKAPLGCEGQPVTFIARLTNGGVNPVYQWYVNDVAQGGNSDEFTPASITATDKVRASVTNTSDCTTSATQTSAPVSPVYMPQVTPIVTIAPSSGYPACEGIAQTFTATVVNGGANPVYQWQLNNVNVGANSDQFTSTTLKNGDLLTCTVSNAAQCTIPGTSDEFAVQTYTTPSVSFSDDVTIKKGESIVLSPVLSGDIASYSWTPSAGLNNPAIANPVASPTTSTTYTLTVTSAGGCPASASIKVNVIEQMVIPNTFTPNGDGFNDTWSIPGLAAYPNCRVNVYNRYGAGIFTSIGYTKNWNGSFNGYVLPSGTYYYTIDLKDGKKPLSGYVVLLK